VTDAHEPHDPSTFAVRAEPVPVQLTRMEGVLNLIAYRINELAATVSKHDDEINKLKLSTQRLDDDAKAGRETAIALAEALKEADEARRARSGETWTPFQRAFVAISALTAIAAVVLTRLA